MTDCLLDGSPSDSPAHALAEMLSAASEECWCAGWLDGCEYSLWRAVVHDDGQDFDWGMGTVLRSELREMRALAEQIGGWVAWHEKQWDGDGNYTDAGARLVPMAKWLEMFEEHERKYGKVHHG